MSYVNDLLSQAEQRLHEKPSPSGHTGFPACESSHGVPRAQTTGNHLIVRETTEKTIPTAGNKRSTAGSDWFHLPKTDLTPEFKREWQLLRMRGLLDPKHKKKSLRFSVPEYSQVGEVVAGPADFHSSRLTRKERKATLLEEIVGTLNEEKLQKKYAGIQRDRSSGRKAFYQKLMSRRRRQH